MKYYAILVLALCFSKAPAIEDEVAEGEQIECFTDFGNPNNVSVECHILGVNLTPERDIWKQLLDDPHIKSLRIDVTPYGNLTFIPSRLLAALDELEKFRLLYATLDALPAHSFANMSALTQLDLAGNQIASMAPRAFAHLPRLAEVNLDDNRVRELRREVFVDAPALRKLFIAKNNMSTLHDGAFEALHGLRELELATNDIAVLTRETFTGLRSLLRLDLSFNKVAMLGDETFAECPRLEELLLESNSIKLIAQKAFAGLGRLRQLNLKNNQLASLPPMVFDGVTSLYYLDLRTNFLETLTVDSIRPIMHNLINATSYFLVELNVFTCDCRLAWTHRLHNQTQNAVMRTQLEDMLCYLSQPDGEQDEDDADADATTISSLETDEAADADLEYEYFDENDQHPSGTRRFLQIPFSELPCTEEALAAEEIRQIMSAPVSAQSDFESAGAVINRPGLVMTTLLVCAIVQWL